MRITKEVSEGRNEPVQKNEFSPLQMNWVMQRGYHFIYKNIGEWVVFCYSQRAQDSIPYKKREKNKDQEKKKEEEEQRTFYQNPWEC